MAKIVSQIATSIRGSIGGITFSATRNHAIVAKARVGPARLPTNRGNTVRTSLQFAQALWGSLTESQRQQWAYYADTCVFSGPQGTYKLTGLQMFIRTLATAKFANEVMGGSFVVTGLPPVIAGLPNVGPITEGVYVGPGTGVAVNVTGLPVEDCSALVRVSIPWKATRYKNPNIWDTSKSLLVPCPAATTTLVEVDDLVEDAYYFVSVRAMLDDSPLRVDTEYVFRLQAVTVSP